MVLILDDDAQELSILQLDRIYAASFFSISEKGQDIYIYWYNKKFR